MEVNIGDIVLYKLSEYDIEEANKYGNNHLLGQEVPLIVVRVWKDEFGPGVPGVNGQIVLDGMGLMWVTSKPEGMNAGSWHRKQ